MDDGGLVASLHIHLFVCLSVRLFGLVDLGMIS
jgi:hypothetical protein